MKRKVISLITATTLLINPVMADAHQPSRTERISTYSGYCERIGNKYGISPELLEAIIYCESNYNPNETSGCNAQGLCQIIPKYQKQRMKKLGISNLYDPYSNILCCADIIEEFAEKYEDLYLVLACYNKGEYSNAKSEYENGKYSKYAIKVCKKAAELEKEHGK